MDLMEKLTILADSANISWNVHSNVFPISSILVSRP